MSLFKVTNWWSGHCGVDDSAKDEHIFNYDSNSLYSCHLSIDDNAKDCLLVGSHSGLLSIFQPNYMKLDDSKLNTKVPGFKYSDVVLETVLTAPILQILEGKFASGIKSETNSILAILHPKKLCIYQLVILKGDNQSKVQLINEYLFKKQAFSLCKGNFGRIKGKEFLCVQFIDSSLRFFEQDGIQYEYTLPGNRNIPSKIEYVPRIDCFVTVSPSWELECFRYQDMAETNTNLQKNVPIWSVCIGEYALDINVVQTSNVESMIIVMGENNLFYVSDTGKIKFIKRLDFSPICLYSFLIGWYWEPATRLIVCVVSEHGAFLLFENAVLLWCAQLLNIPVALRRANFNNLPGAIVTVHENGMVNVGYLGSEPHLFKVPNMNLQQLDFESTQKELLELEEIIKSGVDSDEISVVNSTAEANVVVEASVSPELLKSENKCSFALPDSEDETKMCRISISIRSKVKLEELQICINVCPPLATSNDCFVFRNLSENIVESFNSTIYMTDTLDVPNLDVLILISFIDKQGIPRVIEKTVKLPIEFLLKLNPPQKETKYKMTLLVSGSKHELSEIFPGLAKTGSQAIGFKSIYSGAITTIVSAKNSNRFRIQSDSLSGMSVMLSIMKDRLESLISTSSGKLQTSLQIPNSALLAYLEDHHATVEEVTQIKGNLDALCSQFTLFQRCYITKLHDLRDNALDGIEMLIGLTQKEIAEVLTKMKEIELKLFKSQVNLSCVLHFLNLVIHHLPLPTQKTKNLCAAIAMPINDWMDQCWEDMVAPSFDVTNRIGPLGKNKNYGFDDIKCNISEPMDIKKLLNDFSGILERVFLMAGTETAKSDESAEELQKDFEENVSEWLNVNSFKESRYSDEYDAVCLEDVLELPPSTNNDN